MDRIVLDPLDGRVVSASLADYLVPVNLDIGTLDVAFVEEDDRYANRLGATLPNPHRSVAREG